MPSPGRAAAGGSVIGRLKGLLITALIVMSGLAVARGAELPDLRQLARHHGFDDAAIGGLLAGEIVATDAAEITGKQLAVTVAMIAGADLDHMARTVLDGQIMDADRKIIDFGRIDPAAPEIALAKVSFGESEAGEVERLLSAEPGADINLSAEEIAVLREVAARHASRQANDPVVVDAVMEAWRAILAGRLRAYLDRGLDGLAPYDRGEGALTDPAEELRAAAEGMVALHKAQPELHRALLDYPQHQAEDVQHAYFWLKRRSHDGPAMMLAHLMVRRQEAELFFLARVFYAAHTVNASQVVASAVPTRQGHAVFYTVCASSDEVDGLLGLIRQDIGRGIVRNGALESLRAAREVWGR